MTVFTLCRAVNVAVNAGENADGVGGIVDSVSSLTVALAASDFTGSINAAREGGSVSVSMDEKSTWTLTADSYITAFDGDIGNVDGNGYTLYVNGDAAN